MAAQRFVRGAGLQSCDPAFLLDPSVDLVVVVGFEAVARGQAVLAHHEHLRYFSFTCSRSAQESFLMPETSPAPPRSTETSACLPRRTGT